MGAVVLQQAVVQAVNASPSWVEYASDLFRTAFALGAVCLLAWAVLRFAAARGLGKRPANARLEVIERLGLDGQRSVVLLRVERRRLLIGLGAGAAPQLIAEFDGDAIAAGDVTATAQDLTAFATAQKSDATH